MIKKTTGLSLVLLASSALQGAVLYEQDYVMSGARFSDYGSVSQVGFNAYDDFTASVSGTVERVVWQGIWLDLNKPVPEPIQTPDAMTWEVSFYADGGGIPGALLETYSFPAASIGSTSLGTGVWNVGGDSYNFQLLEYAADLPTGFQLNSGTPYWLLVMARSENYYPAFAWMGGEAGNSNTMQVQLGAGESVLNTSFSARDRAFRLEGQVPEPGTFFFAAAALLGLPLAQRWKKRA